MGVVGWILRCQILGACFPSLDVSWMPHRYNAARRHGIARQKYRATNWTAYNESLRQRGDLTIWVNDEVLCLWAAPRRTSRGRAAPILGSGDDAVFDPACRRRAAAAPDAGVDAQCGGADG